MILGTLQRVWRRQLRNRVYHLESDDTIFGEKSSETPEARRWILQ